MTNKKGEAPGPHVQGTSTGKTDQPIRNLPSPIGTSKAIRARALAVAVAALDAACAAVAAVAQSDSDTESSRRELLDVSQTLASYGVGRSALLNAAHRGELMLLRGARQRLLVRRDEIERWIESRRVIPTLRDGRSIVAGGSPPNRPAETEAEWQRRCDAQLAAMRGGK